MRGFVFMENEMVIIGIDISLKSTGLAVIKGHEEIIETKSVGYLLKKGEGKIVRNKLIRWFKIWNEVSRMIKEHNVTHVFIEDYAFSRGQAEFLAELHGVIMSQLYLTYKILPKKIGITQWRKYYMKKVKSYKKPEVVKALRLNHECLSNKKETSEDECEAVGIAIAGYRSLTDIEVKADLIK